MVPCVTSPLFSAAKHTPPAPARVEQTSCRGVLPQMTMIEMENTASVQVNVSLTVSA